MATITMNEIIHAAVRRDLARTEQALRAFEDGDVVLASCACEPQMDLVLNLESRLDDVAGNIVDGFDWTTRPDAVAGLVRVESGRATLDALYD